MWNSLFEWVVESKLRASFVPFDELGFHCRRLSVITHAIVSILLQLPSRGFLPIPWKHLETIYTNLSANMGQKRQIRGDEVAGVCLTACFGWNMSFAHICSLGISDPGKVKHLPTYKSYVKSYVNNWIGNLIGWIILRIFYPLAHRPQVGTAFYRRPSRDRVTQQAEDSDLTDPSRCSRLHNCKMIRWFINDVNYVVSRCIKFI